MPTATVVTHPFHSLFQVATRSLGQEGLPAVYVAHPIVSVEPAAMRERASNALAEITRAVVGDGVRLNGTTSHQTQPSESPSVPETLRVSDHLEDILDRFEAEEWTDGLPIVPPTRERVARMLAYCDLEPSASLGLVPPRWSHATVTKLAVNAVMAGCRPEHFPVVLAAVRSMLERQFNLYGVQGTTNPASPIVVASGPIARELGINAGGNLFGPASRASATIGRAIRLILTSIGGGVPQRADKSTLGNPAKYTCCFAENEAACPWPPLQVEQGFGTDTSSVLLFAGAAPTNIIDKSRTVDEMLETIAGVMVSPGSNNLFMSQQILVVLCPDHAAIAAAAGLDRAAVSRELFQRARVDLDQLTSANADVVRSWRRGYIDHADGRQLLRIVERPEDILVVVAGGPGNHSAVIAGWHSRAVAQPVARANGALVRSVNEFRTEASICV